MSARDNTTDDGHLIRPDIGMLHPSPTNPRKHFDETALGELADSIRSNGILQPILARVMPREMAEQLNTLAQLEIVAGERRWRAAKLAGLEDVPVLLRDLDNDQVEALQIIENLQREGLSPIEESEGYGKLADKGMTAQAIAERVGKTKSYIHGKLKLRALCLTVAQAAHRKEIVEAVALEIARIPVEAMQIDALRVVTARNEYTSEPMSYRDAKAHIRNAYTKNLAKAPFDTTDASLCASAGSCTDCPKRLGNQPDTEPASANVCTDPDCYNLKRIEHNAQSAGAPADTPRVDIPRANAGYPANYEDLDRAGYRVIGKTNHHDPERRTYRQWLADNGESVPLAIYVCPLSYDAIIVARITDLIAASERIAAKQADADEQLRLDVATEQPEPEPADTAPETPHQAPTADSPRKHAQPTASAAPRRREHSPLEIAYTQYRKELKDRIRANPPLMIGGPLLQFVALAVQGHGLSETPTESEAIDILIGVAIAHAEKWSIGGKKLLEQLADALGIDHAELLERHIPVPDGCSRPNEHGVFEKQKTLSTRGGNAVVLIHRSQTADGWRAEPEFSSPTRSWSGPISLNTPAFEKECQAIEYATREAHRNVERDNDIPDKNKKHLLRWLEKLNTEAGGDGIAPGQAADISTGHLMRYHHPENPSIKWSGKGRKPQWVADWITSGKPLADLETKPEQAEA